MAVVDVVYGRIRSQIIVTPSATPEELRRVIQARFGVVPLGFETQYDFVIPLEVLCSFTYLYQNQRLTLIPDLNSLAIDTEILPESKVESLRFDVKTNPISKTKNPGIREKEPGIGLMVPREEIYTYAKMIELEKLHTIVMRACKHGPLDKEAFQRVMQALLPKGTTIDTAAPYLTTLGSLFDLFDHNDDGVVDRDELLSGLSLLCRGSVDERLEVVFSLVDRQGDGYITRPEMIKFLKLSHLLKIALSYPPAAPLPKAQIMKKATKMATESADIVFLRADLERNGVISFPEFKSYCSKYPHLVRWIDIFDRIREKPRRSGVQAAVNGQSTSIVLRTDEGREIEVQTSDHFRNIRELFQEGGSDKTAETIIRMFHNAARKGSVDRKRFRVLMTRILNKTRETPQRIGFQLDSLFDMFDVSGTGLVDAGEFVTGILIFCRGTKLEKLRLAFGMFDTHKTGYISRDEMFRFIDSFIRASVPIGQNSFSPTDDVSGILNTLALQATKEFFSLADTNDDDQVSWSEFLRFYRQYGQKVQWLELLNRMMGPDDDRATVTSDKENKSPPAWATFPVLPLSPLSENKAVSPEGLQMSLGSAGDPRRSPTVPWSPTLQSPMVPEPWKRRIEKSPGSLVIGFPEGGEIVLKPSDVTRFRFIRTIFARHATELFERMSKHRFMERFEFLTILSEGLDIQNLPTDVQQVVKEAIGRLFDSFDYNKDGVVDVEEFTRGFAILSRDGKEEALRLVFDIIDENGNGQVTMPELCQFFASFLLMTVAMCQEAQELPSNYLKNLVFQASHQVCESFFKLADVNGDGVISFGEFIRVHKKHRDLVPWLNLLDMADEQYTEDIKDTKESLKGGVPNGVPIGEGLVTEDKTVEGGEELKTSVVFLNEDLAILNLVKPLFGDIEVDTILKIVQSEYQPGGLTERAYTTIIADLFHNSITDNGIQGQMLRRVFHNIFRLADCTDTGLISAREVLTMLWILTLPSVDDKLKLVYIFSGGHADPASSMRSEDQIAGVLEKSEIERFVCCMMLLGFAPRQLSGKQIRVLRLAARKEAKTAADALFVARDPDGKGCLDFKEFSRAIMSHPFGKVLSIFAQDSEPASPPGVRVSSPTPTPLIDELTEDPGEVLVIEGEGHTVTMRLADFKILAFLREALGSVGFEKLLKIFGKYADEKGLLDRPAFEKAVDALVPADATEKDRFLFRFILHRMFQVFDSNADGAVDCFEYLSGVNFLLKSDLNDKLEIAFKMVDTNRNGSIEFGELLRFFCSFFSLLLAVSSQAREIDFESLRNIAYNIAMFHTETLFKYADLNHDSRISLSEFKAAYSQHEELFPWIQALSFSSDHIDVTGVQGSSLAFAVPPDEKEEVVLKIDVSLSNGGRFLFLTKEDMAKVDYVRTFLAQFNFTQLLRVFSDCSGGGDLDQKTFSDAMHQLIPSESLKDDHERDHLEQHLKSLYYIFDRDQDGLVNVNDFLCGLYVFCNDPPRKKTMVIFSIIDLDQDDEISYEEMVLFYRSVTAALVGLSAWTHSIPPKHLSNLLWNAAKIKTAEFFAILGKGRDDSITFQEFSSTLSENPATTPWVLDVQQPEGRGFRDTLGQRRGGEGEALMVGQVAFTGEDLAMMLGELEKVASVTQLGSTITQSNFNQIWDRLIPVESKYSTRINSFKQKLFAILDSSGTGSVDATVLTMALTVFLDAENLKKIKYAFNLADANEDGSISREEMFKIQFAVAATAIAKERFGIEKVPEKRKEAIDLAKEISEKVFKIGDLDRNERITLDEFIKLTQSNPSLLPWLLLSTQNASQSIQTETSSQKGAIEFSREEKGRKSQDSKKSATAPLTVEKYRLLSDMAGLGVMPVTDIYAILRKVSGKSAGISREKFTKVMDGVCVGRGTREFVEIFNAFDSLDQDIASANDIAFYLSVFTKGTPEEKLRAAYEAYDVSLQGELSKMDMFFFMRALVTISLVASGSVKEKKGLHALSSTLSRKTIILLFDAAKGERIGFEELLEISSKDPEICPWIRAFYLLSRGEGLNSDSDEKKEEGKQKEDISGVEAVASLLISQKILRNLPETSLFHGIRGVTERGWNLAEFSRNFQKILEQSPAISEGFKASDAQILFHAFDSDQDGLLTLSELCAGLLAARGDPISGGLISSLELFNSDSGKGEVSKVELFSLLMACVRILLRFSLMSATGVQKVEKIAYEQAQNAVKQIFKGIEGEKIDINTVVERIKTCAPWMETLEYISLAKLASSPSGQ